jgi:hypothetical protein
VSPEIQDALAKAEPLSDVKLDESASAHIIGRDCKHLQWETYESWLWSWGFVHARIASATMILVCSCYPAHKFEPIQYVHGWPKLTELSTGDHQQVLNAVKQKNMEWFPFCQSRTLSWIQL